MLLSNTASRICQFWHPVCSASELGDSPMRVQLAGRSFVIARLGDGILFREDRCPHRGASLHRGTIIGNVLRCPYHGHTFGLGQSGGSRQLSVACAQHYKATISDGLVWVAALETVESPPSFPPVFARSRSTLLPSEIWNAPASVIIDNFVDATHFGYIHAGSFSIPGDVPKVSNLIVSDNWDEMAFTVRHRGVRILGTPSASTATLRFREVQYSYKCPFSLKLIIFYEDDPNVDQISLHLRPIDDHSTAIYKILIGNSDGPCLSESERSEARRFQAMVSLEDREICEDIGGIGVDTDLPRYDVIGDAPSVALYSILERAYS